MDIQQENAVRVQARNVVIESNKMTKKQRKDERLTKHLIDKHYSKVSALLKRTLFIRYIAISSGVLSDHL
jgi:hypothetical protein